MVAESRFWPNNPNFGFFLLRVHAVNELGGPIDDSIKKGTWVPPYSNYYSGKNRKC